jgi:hypothetical protein
METTAIVPHQPITQRGADLHLVAETPAEMSQCHESLIAWCRAKVAACMAESIELQQAFEHAVAKKWKYSVLKRHAEMAKKRVIYYEKILVALENGYCIVPNFPVEMFAIRTKTKTPKGEMTTQHWAAFQQKSKELPQGEGAYKNPFPVVLQGQFPAPPHPNAPNVKQEVTKVWPSAWDDLEFPITMAKPEIMQMVDRAMALKVFDELGVLPRNRKEDPLIVGRMHCGNKLVTFIVAWHINTRDL